jgi:hypothetical protein
MGEMDWGDGLQFWGCAALVPHWQCNDVGLVLGVRSRTKCFAFLFWGFPSNSEFIIRWHVSSCHSSQILLTKFRSLPPTFEMTPNAVEELKFASKHLVCDIYVMKHSYFQNSSKCGILNQFRRIAPVQCNLICCISSFIQFEVCYVAEGVFWST